MVVMVCIAVFNFAHEAGKCSVCILSLPLSTSCFFSLIFCFFSPFFCFISLFLYSLSYFDARFLRHALLLLSFHFLFVSVSTSSALLYYPPLSYLPASCVSIVHLLSSNPCGSPLSAPLFQNPPIKKFVYYVKLLSFVIFSLLSHRYSLSTSFSNI